MSERCYVMEYVYRIDILLCSIVDSRSVSKTPANHAVSFAVYIRLRSQHDACPANTPEAVFGVW
jgi:hypothetical protein